MLIEVLLVTLIILVILNLYFTVIKPKVSTNYEKMQAFLENLEKNFYRLQDSVKNEISQNREETNKNAKEMREELSNQLIALIRTNEEKLDRVGQTFRTSVNEFNELQKQKFDSLINKQNESVQTAEQRLEKLRELLEAKLKSIQDDNNDKLEKMRQTVDEKLHKTLEERLGESFKIVSDRLEQVHRGLGEMQSLANGVGDLKKVLSNIRTRGSLGEYRLEMILEQILAPDQYQKNVVTKLDSKENVEFAIKIPSKDTENETIWLPVDSKFPQDKYQALLDSYDKGDSELIEEAVKELEKTIKSLAKDIRDKYINPPFTTDFAIMFLPFEGLYAEVVKRPFLFETLQRDYKINIVGPSTFAAFIHSLQMGFRTLAIQKRSSEVWALLGAVKTQFGKFAIVLDGVQKNLSAASNKIQDASAKSKTIERKLRSIEALPQTEVVKYLGDSFIDNEPEDDNTEHDS